MSCTRRLYQIWEKSNNLRLNYWWFSKFSGPLPKRGPNPWTILRDAFAELCQIWTGHRTIILSYLFCFKILLHLLHLDIQAIKRRVRSKTEAKFCTFWPPPCKKIREYRKDVREKIAISLRLYLRYTCNLHLIGCSSVTMSCGPVRANKMLSYRRETALRGAL